MSSVSIRNSLLFGLHSHTFGEGSAVCLGKRNSESRLVVQKSPIIDGPLCVPVQDPAFPMQREDSSDDEAGQSPMSKSRCSSSSAPRRMPCLECGELREPWHRFCTNCGSPNSDSHEETHQERADHENETSRNSCNILAETHSPSSSQDVRALVDDTMACEMNSTVDHELLSSCSLQGSSTTNVYSSYHVNSKMPLQQTSEQSGHSAPSRPQGKCGPMASSLAKLESVDVPDIVQWSWPEWALDCNEPCIEVYVKRRWIKQCLPIHRMIHPDGYDQYLTVQYLWEEDVHEWDFEPQHVRPVWSKKSVLDMARDGTLESSRRPRHTFRDRMGSTTGRSPPKLLAFVADEELRRAKQEVYTWCQAHNFQDVNAEQGNFHGRKYPLHVAVESHESDVVRLLIKCGARKDLKDSRGQTPMQLAQKMAQSGKNVGASKDILDALQ